MDKKQDDAIHQAFYAIPKRAHTPEQKRAVIERVYSAWLAAPELRLGQLLVGASLPYDVFYREDEELCQDLETGFLRVEGETHEEEAK